MPLNNCLNFFANFIETELGIVFSEQNFFQLQNRLEEIAKALNIKNVDELYIVAEKGIGCDLRQLLLDRATNNETSFFRDEKIFRALETTFLRKALAAGRKDVLRIWSAACSTGQEPLTLAMMIQEFCERESAIPNFKITATDISERVLEKAKSFTYTQLEVQRGLPSILLLKYFKSIEHDKWQANTSICEKIEFKKQNLLSPFPFPQKFDLVLCRNVLIYQNIERKTQILKRITATLTDSGILVLGSGESLLGISNDYSQEAVDGAIIYRKKKNIMEVA